MAVTWNPSDKASEISLSAGNLTATKNGSDGDAIVRSTAALTGEDYIEFTLGAPIGNDSLFAVGLTTAAADLHDWPGGAAGVAAFDDNGIWKSFSSVASFSGTAAPGAVICMERSTAGGYVRFRVNGGAWSSNVSTSGLGTLYVVAYLWHAAADVTLNAGATAFAYTPSSGFAGPDSGGASYALAGSTAGAGAATGALGRRASIGGTSSSAGIAAAAMGARRPLAAVSAGLGAATGVMRARRPLAGPAAGEGSATATVGAGPGAIAGTAVGVGTALGAMLKRAPLVGDAAGLGAGSMDMQGGSLWSPEGPAGGSWTPAGAAEGIWTPTAAASGTWV